MPSRTLQLDLLNGRLQLPAQIALAALAPGVAARHAELGMRPALATYNVSIGAITARLDRVLKRIQMVSASGASTESADELLDAHESLLHGFMQHMEECVGILKGLSSDDLSFRKDPRAKSFGAQVREYRNHIGAIVNRIKHNQGRLRFVSARMRHRPDIWWCGYFVEGAAATGGVGPDSTIHPGGSGAFSFNRDLRHHLCELLLTSEALAQAVRPPNSDVGRHETSGLEQETLLPLLEAVAALPGTYFPDEYEKPRPLLQRTRAGTREHLTVKIAADASWRPYAGQFFEISVSMQETASLDHGGSHISRYSLSVRDTQADALATRRHAPSHSTFNGATCPEVIDGQPANERERRDDRRRCGLSPAASPRNVTRWF